MASSALSVQQAEFRRQRRVVDQALTMHAVLRDRYHRKANVVTLAILGSSVAGLSFAFVPGEAEVSLLGATALRSTWLGLLAAVIFFLSLVELKIDWRGLAWAHGDAARQLGELKAAYRRVGDWTLAAQADLIALSRHYGEVFARIQEIPDRKFAALKQLHVKKVALSKAIDAAPGRPLWLLRLQLWMRSVRGSK